MNQADSPEGDTSDENSLHRVFTGQDQNHTPGYRDSSKDESDNQSDTEETGKQQETINYDELLIAMPDLPYEKSEDSDSSIEPPNVDPDASDRLVSTIGATSVIDALEQLSYQRKSTATEVAYLKHRYLKLCSCLAMSRDGEFDLLQHAKRLTIELESLHEELAKADTYPENYNTQADQLRMQLLQAENQRLEREEHCDELSYILEGLQEEKKMLQREYGRLPKEEETKHLRRQLEQSIEELKLENSKKTGETRQLIQTLKDAQEALNEEMKLSEDAKQKVDSLNNELNEQKLIPLHYARESDKVAKQLDEARKLRVESTEEYGLLREEFNNLDALRIKLEIESAKLNGQSAKKQRRIFDMQTQYDAVNSQLEMKQQKAAELALERTEAELRMNHLMNERALLHDRVKRLTRERDEAVRDNRKAEYGLQAIKDAVKFAKMQRVEKRAACTKFKMQGLHKDVEEKRRKLLAEVVALQGAVLQQSGLSEAEQTRVRKIMADQSQMNLELGDLRIETVELARLAAIKADEREQKSRDFRAASSRYTRIVDEIKTKKLQIQEYEKSLRETVRHSRDFATLYDAIKEERSNCLSLIQLAQQRMQEMQEKMRICANEVQILRENFTQKNLQIGRLRNRYKISVTDRDGLRSELSKQDCLERELESRKEQLTMEIESHNREIFRSKQAMMNVTEDMTRVLQLRNDRAVQLIERNEELCVLQEKSRILEQAQVNGESELSKLDEQLQWLHQEKQDLERSNQLYKKSVTHRRELEGELTSRQIQLALCKDRVTRLEKAAIDPTFPVIDSETNEPVCLDLAQVSRNQMATIPTSLVKPRARELAGKDMDPAEIRSKMDSIQCQLLVKEHKLLEFDMLLKSVNRLVEKLESRAALDKEITLQWAKQMNARKTDVKQTSKKLKSNTAEMAMLMAIAFKLEQKVQERRCQLAQCYKRMESGEVPCDEFEKAWKRYERRKNQKPLHVWEEYVYEDSWTTAEERPNAYLAPLEFEKCPPQVKDAPPNTEETITKLLVLRTTHGPVPFGAHAPFRPTGPSANMRHFRKPKLPDLET
ncbi:Coiled-coil domain-containing protein [Fasciola hepatica]|uniref:Coiled-coil domain-containing protein n=1 Tax=Fasciola hepatica TaxID=6192 RepID=A0A4E0RG96_FASHE|nr:Coiled-coil domain-containing protein [Fasciola hepatica]